MAESSAADDAVLTAEAGSDLTVGPSFLLQPLAEHHAVGDFNCKRPNSSDKSRDRHFNKWIATKALTIQRNRYTAIHVLVPESEPNKVAAFFTLSNASVITEAVSDPFNADAPFPDIPAIYLGMLAGDHRFPGMLPNIMRSALELTVEAAGISAARLLIIDAADERLASLYEDYGFIADYVPGEDRYRMIYLVEDAARDLAADNAAEA